MARLLLVILGDRSLVHRPQGAGGILSKVAFAVLNGRISPVFDASRQALVVEEGDATARTRESLSPAAPSLTARRLAAAGVRTLVCGAISRSMAALLAGQGIGVIAFVAGDVGDVVAAHLGGVLPNARFLMPGCTLEQLTARPRGVQPARPGRRRLQGRAVGVASSGARAGGRASARGCRRPASARGERRG